MPAEWTEWLHKNAFAKVTEYNKISNYFAVIRTASQTIFAGWEMNILQEKQPTEAQFHTSPQKFGQDFAPSQVKDVTMRRYY
jgi:hypothetical protein